MDPNAMAALSGGAGALGMLLLVLLALVAFAWPMLRAVVRFVGNFQTVTISRAADGIRFTGAVDDWRAPFADAAERGAEHLANAGSLDQHFDLDSEQLAKTGKHSP